MLRKLKTVGTNKVKIVTEKGKKSFIFVSIWWAPPLLPGKVKNIHSRNIKNTPEEYK